MTAAHLLDEFQRGWVLLSEDGRWASATRHTAERLGADVTFVHLDTDVTPVAPQAFGTTYGIAADGATLVRPDGYIAWRTLGAPPDPAEALTTALATVSSATVGTRAGAGR